MREGRRQIGRHDAWDQECQPEEAEAVEDEKRPQRFGSTQEAEFWPDVSRRDDPPRDEAECDAHEKAELRQHDSLLLRGPCPLTVDPGCLSRATRATAMRRTPSSSSSRSTVTENLSALCV